MLYIIIDKNNSNFKSVNVNIFVKVFALVVKWFTSAPIYNSIMS